MKTQSWIALTLVGAGIVLTIVIGVYSAFTINSRPLHADPAGIPSVIGAPPPPKWAGAVKAGEQIARAAVIEQNLPGLSAAIGVDGHLVWAEGFGWATLDGHAPVGPDTQFRIGHVSVPLTSAAAGELIEKGQLRLDDDIQDRVPAFPKKNWPVTLRDVMGNLAGVRHYKDDEWGDKPSAHCERASEGLPVFANDPLLHEPETKYTYSTYGWVLTSAAIESAAGEPFFEFMRTHVFDPLGMNHTTVDMAGPARGRATSYFRGNFNNVITTDVDYSCFAGGGAFVSTPSDLVRFGAAMMPGNTGAAIVQPDTIRRLQARQQLRGGGETDYGLGWMLDTVELGGEKTRIAGHSSRTLEGAATSFWTFPDRGIVVAVSTNMSFADMKSVALALANAFAK